MPPRAFDTIVVGLGGMGSAACFHLAKAGQRVLGLERFDLGHGMGSSHGLTRIIRLAYFEGPEYVPFVRRAHQLWQETGAEAGQHLLHVTGSIDIAPEGSGFAENSQASCIEHGLDHLILGARDIEGRFPGFSLDDDHIGLLQPDGGFVASERAIYAHAGLALKYGATLHTGETVRAWSVTAQGGVIVETDRDRYSAGSLVVAAGAWTAQILPDLQPALTTVRQAIAWFAPMRAELYAPDRFPVFTLLAESGHFYGFPIWDHPGVKVGGPHFGREPIDPDSPERHVSERQRELLSGFVAQYLPGAAGNLLTARGCLYTVTPDEHFIIDRLPGAPQVIVVSACSGHGFKFASAIGEAVKDLAIGRETRFNRDLFRFERVMGSAIA